MSIFIGYNCTCNKDNENEVNDVNWTSKNENEQANILAVKFVL